MKPVYYLIISAAVPYPNIGLITKLIKKLFISKRLLDNLINGTILAKAFSFRLAFSQLSEQLSLKFEASRLIYAK